MARIETSPAAVRSGVVTQLPDELALLLAVEPEAVRVAVLAGVSATIANSIAWGPVQAHARLIVQYFPRESSLLITASGRYKRWFTASPAAAALSRFLAAVDTAKRASLDFASASFTGDAPALALAWQRACTAAAVLLATIDAEIGRFGMVRNGADSAPLYAMLEKAQAGDSSMVRSDGTIELPRWAEQREHRRSVVRCPGALLRRGRELPVLVRDVSPSGAGIETGQILAPGERVVLRLGDTLLLEAVVVWCEQGRCGLAFAESGAGSDPLLKFVMAQGRRA